MRCASRTPTSGSPGISTAAAICSALWAAFRKSRTSRACSGRTSSGRRYSFGMLLPSRSSFRSSGEEPGERLHVGLPLQRFLEALHPSGDGLQVLVNRLDEPVLRQQLVLEVRLLLLHLEHQLVLRLAQLLVDVTSKLAPDLRGLRIRSNSRVRERPEGDLLTGRANSSALCALQRLLDADGVLHGFGQLVQGKIQRLSDGHLVQRLLDDPVIPLSPDQSFIEDELVHLCF